MEWIDVSSPGAIRRKRKTFKFDHHKINLTITSDHIKYPKNWIMHCPVFGVVTAPIICDIENEAEAKRLALEKLQKLSDELHKDINIIVATMEALG